MVGRYPLTLRWDNVITPPVWVSGAKPFPVLGARYNDAERRETVTHRVRLAPGDSVTVWVPANEGVRIYRSNARLTQEDLEVVTASNGSGLYVELPTQLSAAGYSLLLPPDSPEERLVRILRPAHAPDALEIALFVSRREALGQLAPYQEVIPFAAEPRPEPESAEVGQTDTAAASWPHLAAKPLATTDNRVLLRPGDEATAEPFWRLETAAPLKVRLRGPLRLELEHRLRYPLMEQQTRQAYRIYAWLNDRPWQALDFVAGQKTRRAIVVDGCAETLGRLETGYLDLPDGEHELVLRATQPLYVRLQAQQEPDYLFPTLNAPKLTAAEARAMRPVPHGSIWDLDLKELRQPLDQLPLIDRERVALRLGRDNYYQEGGLAVALGMRQAALAQREEPRLTLQAGELLGLFTFYRSLLPVFKPAMTPPRLAWLRQRRLLGLSERPRELVVAKRFAEDLLGNLAAVSFFELPPAAELEYRLPVRRQPSLLRIAVEPTDSAPAELSLRYDDQPPRRLRLQPPELASHLFLPSTGEAALLLWAEQHGVPAANTLTAPFAAQRPPAPLVEAAVMEIPLPASVRRIRLSGANRPLAVALQYRASRPFQLSESEYLEAAQLMDSENCFSSFKIKSTRPALPPLSHPTSRRRVLRSGATPGANWSIIGHLCCGYCAPRRND